MHPLLNGLTLPASKVRRPSLSESLKFALRACLHPRAHHAWRRFLVEDARREALASAHPQLLWKLQRPYLDRRVDSRTKLSWLCEHHRWAETHLPATWLNGLSVRGQVTVAEFEAGEQPYRLSLSLEEQFAKEGELALLLQRDGQRLAVLAFTVHQEQGRWLAHIGCLQGAQGAEGAEAIKLATRELQGLRPKQAILLALYALVGTHGVHEVLAVSNLHHIYQAKRRRRERVLADYDSFWAELGALPVNGSFRLPPRLARKALDDIPSRKRAQYRRRFELEDQISALIQAAAAAAPQEAPAPDASNNARWQVLLGHRAA